MEKTYGKSPSLLEVTSPFCSGCLHGLAFKLIAEAIDHFDLREKTVGVLPVGCATLAMDYNNYDMIVASHGRAPAIASGYKRCKPDRFVYAYQGDGDLASIGIAEAIHSANRGEKFTTFFINNAIFGMTGGQMAPTTLVGQKTTTCPNGRDPEIAGYPIRMAELIAGLEAPVYVARFALDTPKHILQAKKGIEKAIAIQMANQGYSFIELLSNCPTNWGVSPEASIQWIGQKMLAFFELGEFKPFEGSV
jgi:2-oxoglutarate ferredoxin oxidoreductase subunit beta